MENKKMLRKIRVLLLISVIISVACLIGGMWLWETYGYLWAMVIGWAVFIGHIVWVAIFYRKKISYKCPNCDHVFKPTFWQFILGIHVHTIRRLKCPNCNKKSWCKEVYEQKSTDNE